MSRRRQLAAAQLGHGGSAAGADDEDLLLAPFPPAGHCEQTIVVVAAGGIRRVAAVTFIIRPAAGVILPPLPQRIALLVADVVAERRARANCRCAGAARLGGRREMLGVLLSSCATTTRGSRKRASRCSSRAQTVAVWRRRGCGAAGGKCCGGVLCSLASATRHALDAAVSMSLRMRFRHNFGVHLLLLSRSPRGALVIDFRAKTACTAYSHIIIWYDL